MHKFRTIIKAFVVIAVIPILLVGGILAVSFIAPLCFGGISNPFLAFPALLIMMPWGIIGAIVFFMGVGLTPSFVIVPTGAGGFATSSGAGRGGGGCSLIFNIIKLIILVPTALLIWLVISIIILFSPKLQKKIDELYIGFFANLKKWYKLCLVLFVIAPLIVLGLNELENTIYSPSNIKIECVDFYYDKTWEHHSFNTGTYKQIHDYYLEYTINPNDEDITEIKGEWIFIDNKTGESVSLDAGTFVPFNWHWNMKDKNTAHSFNTTISIPKDQEKDFNIISNNLDDIKIMCKINYICFESNIPFLGDWMFPHVDNEYEDGYLITIKE